MAGYMLAMANKGSSSSDFYRENKQTQCTGIGNETSITLDKPKKKKFGEPKLSKKKRKLK